MNKKIKKNTKYSNYFNNLHKLNQQLLLNIKNKLPELEKLLEEINDDWKGPDGFYRYYHCSFKTFYIQEITIKIFNTLKSLAPKNTTINKMVINIINNGTNKIFKSSTNYNWEKNCRPMLEAFSHMKMFLEQAIKYGKILNDAPTQLPNGWALVLYFYNLR